MQTTGDGPEDDGDDEEARAFEAGALALVPRQEEKNEFTLQCRHRWCPETRAQSPIPEHTALLEQSACQNRSCAPLLPQPLCWSWKAPFIIAKQINVPRFFFQKRGQRREKNTIYCSIRGLHQTENG